MHGQDQEHVTGAQRVGGVREILELSDAVKVAATLEEARAKSKGEPFDLFAEARLRYWLMRDKMLPEQYRSAEKLHEAIFRWCSQVCD